LKVKSPAVYSKIGTGDGKPIGVYISSAYILVCPVYVAGQGKIACAGAGINICIVNAGVPTRHQIIIVSRIQRGHIRE